jgi:hypothetical protein
LVEINAQWARGCRASRPEDRLAIQPVRDDSRRRHAQWHGMEVKGEARVQSEREREIREQIVKLTVEHRELDREIGELEQAGSIDQLNITRLKRRKLKLKDQISSLEDQLFPDIIA